MMQCRKELVCVFLVALISAVGLAADWNQWRGPNRDGLSAETGLLKEWPKSGPPLVWKATGLGAGFSSISISGQRIFTMGDNDGKAYAHALNLADGKNLWSTEIGKAGSPGWGKFEGMRSTPTPTVICTYGVRRRNKLSLFRPLRMDTGKRASSHSPTPASPRRGLIRLWLGRNDIFAIRTSCYVTILRPGRRVFGTPIGNKQGCSRE